MKILSVRRKIIVSILTMMVLIYGTPGNLSYGQATASTVQLLPASVASPAVGEKLTLSVKIVAGTSVAGYEAAIEFDTSALRHVESVIGDYLPTGAFFVPPVVTGNLVKLAATSLAGESSGDGTLATITFEVKAMKASTLTLSNVLLSDSEGTISRPKIEGMQITTIGESTPTSEAYDYIQGPWLWMIAEGSDIDTDYLSTLSNGEVSEALTSIDGVRSGDTLGDLQWTPEVITSSVHCATEWIFIVPVHRCKSNNVQHVVNATGLSTVQDLNHYTAYAFLNIISPRDQTVRMGVGSDDSIKVWLNGQVVHRNNTNRKTSGIQDTFRVNLKAGNNPLLVKVNDDWENWGMFFKIYLEPTEYTTSIYTTGELHSNAADVNEDGQVDIHDLILVIRALGQTAPVDPRIDINNDGRVDKTDLLIIVENLDDSAIPAAPAAMLATLDPATLRAWINVLHAEADDSIAYGKTLAILQRLLATVRPQETKLLANYPNPFNPETWIPYHLAKDGEVTLHIYAVNGQLVRTLALGYQAAGIYQSRSRAAYWDGKNTFGEPVASGVYFYTLSTESTRDSVTAGDFIATRKMLIRK